MTIILKVDAKKPSIAAIKKAAAILKSGGTVAFPTETVYGLGANALDSTAVKKIFLAKGRPQDNPLIVHVAHRDDIRMLAKSIPKAAERLMDAFWPGPLTLIFRKKAIVPSTTAAGLSTVAVRVPTHPVANLLIREAGIPIAAPSANISGKPSPTTGKEVINDLYNRVDAIIDAGHTYIGLESTVVDMTSSPPVLLRPGSITLDDLQSVLPHVETHMVIHGKNKRVVLARSPGMKYRHYAPEAHVIVVEGDAAKRPAKIQELADSYHKQGKKVGIMVRHRLKYAADEISLVGDPHETVARRLFATLRDLDAKKVEVIIAEGVKDKGLGLAIMNRLRKAAYRIVRV
ncbi:TPA: threonylcarbamoyl-AMP synthase [Candidatus Woesearchaeota archaeon]|nr:threonylcarbamoyl-AMP synthase [Candidatus Woesearchaeota archaeon]HII68824.1 threonylcarbamoyl-AMP synthase [Candidatus Woesearchaeota archaeon]